jgi:hypothetical protein
VIMLLSPRGIAGMISETGVIKIPFFGGKA